MTEEENLYEQLSITTGAVIACAAVVGSTMEDPRYDAIREAWEDKLREVIEILARVSDELTLFGEAYDEGDTTEE